LITSKPRRAIGRLTLLSKEGSSSGLEEGEEETKRSVTTVSPAPVIG
jgi:hypothetical protein